MRCSRARTRCGRSRRCSACRRVDVRVAEAHLDWRCPATRTAARAARHLSHHLLAYFWMLRRDAARFEVVLGVDRELPLGAGALAGGTSPTDRRRRLRARLRGRVPNTIDAVSDRDFVLDFLAAAATCATHLSRLGAEIVLWSTRSSGSARSPTRVRAARSCRRRRTRRGRAAAREGAADRRAPGRAARRDARPPADLQQGHEEDKERLFDAVDTLELCLAAARGCRGITSSASGWRRRDEMLAASTSPTCSSGAACRSGSRMASSPAWCASPSSPARALRADARGARPHSEVLDDDFYAVLSQGTWLESKVRGRDGAGARARAARSRAGGARLAILA